MKKLLLTLIAGLVYVSGFAQITLERNYKTIQVLPFKLSSGTWYYGGLDAANNKVMLYNANHSLYKQITLTPLAGYTPNNISYITDNVFNTDNKIEFILSFQSTTVPAAFPKMQIANETSSVLITIDSCAAGALYNIGNATKLITYKYNAGYAVHTAVYAVPGFYAPLTASDDLEPNKISAYPNPTSETISLAYRLKPGQSGNLKVYDINGRLTENFMIDANFADIVLDTRNYASGLYFYQIETEGKAGAREKFVVRH